MKIFSLSIAVFSVLCAASAGAQNSDDEPQWIYRDPTGSEGPVAVFLSRNYREVVVHAQCGRRRGVMALSYPAGPNADGLVLTIDGKPFDLAAVNDANRLPVHLVTADAIVALQSASHVRLDAPEDRNAPWEFGQAAVLARLARTCLPDGYWIPSSADVDGS